MLAALVRFGEENQISFGIESPLDNVERVRSAIDGGLTARAAIRKILGPSGHYHLSCAGSVVLVRDDLLPVPHWLSQRIQKFEIPEASLKTAHVWLGDRVNATLRPKQGGYAASVLDSIPPDRVGPLSLRNTSVLGILCLLSRASKGSTWVIPPTGITFPDSQDVFSLWTVILYPPRKQ